MYVGMSKEQEALRDELRAYYDELLTPDVVADIQKGEGVGQKSKDVWKKMAADGYAGVGWPKEWGGRGLTPDRAVRVLRRVDALGCAGADAHDQLGRADDHALRQRGAEAVLRAEDPRGRDPLRDRLHRARRGHRPRGVADPSRARRRRVRDQRPEGVHESRERRRLHLARGAHQSRGEEAQGHLDHHRAHRHARASGTCRSTTSARPTRTSRTTKTCAFRSATSSARRTAAGGSSPTSSTTSASRCARREWSSACSTTRAHGRRRRSSPTAGASSTRNGCRSTSRGCTPSSSSCGSPTGSVAWLAQSGAALNPADASTIKVYGTEFYMEAARLLMEVMRDQATLQGDSPGAVLAGRVERMLRIDAHPHLRRRHQRDATRPDRDLRAEHARQPPMTTSSRRKDQRMDFALSEEQEELAGARGPHPRGPHGARST